MRVPSPSHEAPREALRGTTEIAVHAGRVKVGLDLSMHDSRSREANLRSSGTVSGPVLSIARSFSLRL